MPSDSIPQARRAGVPTRWNAAAMAVLLALFASGCTTLGPDFEEPEAEVEDHWLETEDQRITDELPIHPEWWKDAFKDPILDELIETAMTQNLTLQSAGLRVLQAQQQLAIAIGFKYPQRQTFDGSATGVQLSRNASDAIPLLSDRFGLYNLGYNLAWEADVWGRFRRLIESASAILDASAAGYDAVMISLVAEVARTYILIRTFEERIDYARQNVGIQKEGLRLADIRFRLGAVSELDVDQAKTLLNNTEGNIRSLEISLQQLMNALAILLGQPPGDMSSMLGVSRTVPSAPAEIAIGMPQDLIRRRPDIRAAERTLAAQSAQIGFAITDLYPHFVLGGSIGLGTTTIGGKNIFDIFGADSINGNLFGAFQWNVFDFNRLKGNVRLQDALFQQLLTDYQNTVLQAQGEVENAIVAYLKSQDQTGYFAEAAAAAERAVKLATLQYEEGAVDYQRVLSASSTLVLQQDVLASTQGAVATNLVQIYKSLGGGWEVRGTATGDELIPEATKDQMRERIKYWDGVLE